VVNGIPWLTNQFRIAILGGRRRADPWLSRAKCPVNCLNSNAPAIVPAPFKPPALLEIGNRTPRIEWPQRSWHNGRQIFNSFFRVTAHRSKQDQSPESLSDPQDHARKLVQTWAQQVEGNQTRARS